MDRNSLPGASNISPAVEVPVPRGSLESYLWTTRTHLSTRQHDKRRRRGHGPSGAPRAQDRVSLTPEGVPAAVPDAPPTSAVVFVSDESRARYPWLPGRVIAWSVWRGPDNVRVQIDESGNAVASGARPVLVRVG
jgi:hypothetical protein